MRKTLCAAALVLALCGPAFAGVIPNPSGPQPLAVAADGDIPTPSADGDIPNPLSAEEVAAQAMLGLIGNLFALL